MIESRDSLGLHSFLSHLASGVGLVLVFERLTLLIIEQDVAVHLLKFLFSVPFGMYSTDQRIFP